MNRRPVFYFTQMLPHYRIPVLERLNERLDGRLVVCAGTPPEASSLETLAPSVRPSFHQQPLKNQWFLGNRFLVQPFRAVFRAHGPPAAVLAEESPHTLNLLLLIRHAHRLRAGTVLWGHFSSNNRRFAPKRHPFDAYRLWLARQADACACYTESIADMLQPYLPEEQLFIARNTLDTDTLFALHDQLAAEGKPAVRRRLGLPPDAAILVFIGRLIPEKGTQLLLDTIQVLSADRAVVLLVIGDGPERSAMETRVARGSIRDVWFLGSIADWAASAPYLVAADVLVNPGYLGLSVNHAFALGLPVVSQASPGAYRYHSPEADYIVPNQNGMLAPHGDFEALVDAIRHVLAHQRVFSERAAAYARAHLTINHMVDGLEAAIRYAEAQRRTSR